MPCYLQRLSRISERGLHYTLTSHWCTAWPNVMSHRKWRKNKQQPNSQVRPSNQLLLSFPLHFPRDIPFGHAVVRSRSKPLSSGMPCSSPRCILLWERHVTAGRVPSFGKVNAKKQQLFPCPPCQAMPCPLSPSPSEPSGAYLGLNLAAAAAAAAEISIRCV